MMDILKRLLSGDAKFFSHKEQMDYELGIELRRDKNQNNYFFNF